MVEDVGPRWWHYPLGYRSTVTQSMGRGELRHRSIDDSSIVEERDLDSSMMERQTRTSRIIGKKHIAPSHR